MHLTEAVTLQNDFATNFLLNELMDITDPDNVNTIANDLFHSKKISKLKAELVRIRDVRDGYKGTLNMKRMAEQLTSASVLTGPSRQSDLQVLKKYVNTFGSDLLRLNNAEVQSLYDQVVKLAESLFDRSKQQMLKAAAAHTVTPPDDATSLSSSSAAPRRRLKEIPHLLSKEIWQSRGPFGECSKIPWKIPSQH